MANHKIRISSNIDQLPIFINSINEKAVKQAVRRSIKRTIPSVTKKSFSEIREGRLLDTRSLNLKRMKQRNFIREDITRTNDIQDMAGIITFADKRPGMSYFFPKKYKAGTSALTKTPLYGVQVNILNKKHKLGRAFLHNKVVLARRTDKRYPLRKLFGPSIPYMLNATNRFNSIATTAEERFSKEMETNMAFYLGKI